MRPGCQRGSAEVVHVNDAVGAVRLDEHAPPGVGSAMPSDPSFHQFACPCEDRVPGRTPRSELAGYRIAEPEAGLSTTSRCTARVDVCSAESRQDQGTSAHERGIAPTDSLALGPQPVQSPPPRHDVQSAVVDSHHSTGSPTFAKTNSPRGPGDSPHHAIRRWLLTPSLRGTIGRPRLEVAT